MPERIKITVRAPGAHPDVLTIQDAMHQVLDFFAMLRRVPGVEWHLAQATTNTPLLVVGEAVSFSPAVDVSVVARTQKLELARSLSEIESGRAPADPDFPAHIAKRFMARNLNGVGVTEIDLENGVPIVVTPKVAALAIDVIERKPAALYESAGAREEIGSIEGTLNDVGTHYNHPAARIIEARTQEAVWCRLTDELQREFESKATFNDVWRHRRVMVRGRIRYDENGQFVSVLASDIRKLEPPHVTLSDIRDPNFTGGLSTAEYLDRFRDGALG